MTDALVIKQEANFFSVAYQEQLYLCTVRANLRKSGRGIKVGDRVVLDHLEAERPVIKELLPRSTDLDKPAVANVDQVLIVMSCLEPDFNAMLIDRLVLSIQYEKMMPVLCVSKADLIDDDLEAWIREEYSIFPLQFFSVESGRGLDQLREQLMERVSVLAGASGVGKSSLINCLDPEIDLSTGEVNQKMGTGKHTTRHVSLHRLQWGERSGWIADSPGFSALQLPPVNRAALADYYPEFQPWVAECGFKDCLHQHEVDCAVQANIDTDSERYYNYLRLLEEVKDRYFQRRDSSTKKESLTKRAVGKNITDQLIKLGTEGRVRSRRTQRQMLEQIGNWSEVDDETIEAMNPDEWRI